MIYYGDLLVVRTSFSLGMHASRLSKKGSHCSKFGGHSGFLRLTVFKTAMFGGSADFIFMGARIPQILLSVGNVCVDDGGSQKQTHVRVIVSGACVY